MPRSPSYLQPTYLNLHEAQIHNIIYDDFGPKAAKKLLRYFSKSLD